MVDLLPESACQPHGGKNSKLPQYRQLRSSRPCQGRIIGVGHECRIAARLNELGLVEREQTLLHNKYTAQATFAWFKSRLQRRKALVQTETLRPEGFLCPGSSSR